MTDLQICNLQLRKKNTAPSTAGSAKGMSVLFLFSFLLFSCNAPTPVTDKSDNNPEDLSMYISEIFEYIYAPGQHAANVSYEDTKKIVGKPESFLHLGGFGGYVVVGFDHDIPNIESEYDFEIYPEGIDAEPAIVYVMCDKNGDGIPNETWYELKGSEFNHPATIRNYEITYYKPKSEKENIHWEDNQGNTGELREGNRKDKETDVFFPTSAWWWNNTTEDSIILTGTRLPDAYINQSFGQQSERWIVIDSLFTWGYAENNKGNDYDKKTRSNRFDISNAVDSLGHPIELKHVRFIKIQTAILQQAGWLNEISSEIKGARDLHYSE